MRYRRILCYFIRTEGIRQKGIYVAIHQPFHSILRTLRHHAELDDGTNEHVVEVLHLQAVGSGFEVGMSDTGVVGEEERRTIRSKSYRPQEQFSTLTQPTAYDRYDTDAYRRGIENLIMEQREGRGVLMARRSNIRNAMRARASASHPLLIRAAISASGTASG